MEQDGTELELSGADDDWPLDHHIEELLGALTDAPRVGDVDSDDVDEPLQ